MLVQNFIVSRNIYLSKKNITESIKWKYIFYQKVFHFWYVSRTATGRIKQVIHLGPKHHPQFWGSSGTSQPCRCGGWDGISHNILHEGGSRRDETETNELAAALCSVLYALCSVYCDKDSITTQYSLLIDAFRYVDTDFYCQGIFIAENLLLILSKSI